LDTLAAAGSILDCIGRNDEEIDLDSAIARDFAGTKPND